MNKFSSVNWQKVKTQNLRATATGGGGFKPLPPYIFTIDSPVFIVSAKNPVARNTWYHAGFLKTAYIDTFLGDVALSSFYLNLGEPKLINLSIGKSPHSKYKSTFFIKQWHRQMNVEVWKYRGSLDDFGDLYQQEILAKLGEVSEYLELLNNYPV